MLGLISVLKEEVDTDGSSILKIIVDALGEDKVTRNRKVRGY